jgi:hypothetical protein
MGDHKNKNMQIVSTNLCAVNSKNDGFIQREHLPEVLDFENQRKLIEFAWGSEMISENTSLKSFKMKEHQESFLIPVSKQVGVNFFLLFLSELI